jgi:hypothetical protein
VPAVGTGRLHGCTSSAHAYAEEQQAEMLYEPIQFMSPTRFVLGGSTKKRAKIKRLIFRLKLRLMHGRIKNGVLDAGCFTATCEVHSL